MKILIVSPQPWEHIRISKHNYAIVLARRGHRVVFLNPPVCNGGEQSRLDNVAEHPGLQILSYARPWFYRLRFHFPRVFDWMMRGHISRLLARHQYAPDLVWCFDFNLFRDLSIFGAKKRLFHPVDPLCDPRQIEPARSADLVVTVSTRIAEQITPVGGTVHVINHGLATPFEILARERLADVAKTSTELVAAKAPLCVGYAGNLCRRPVNRDVLKQIVSQHSKIQFHFWGPADAEPGDAADFVSFLRQQPHVRVHGAVSQEELASAYRKMDAFLLSYVPDPHESDLSNSHKILEYLSAGKVVISSRIQAYDTCSHLLVMSECEADADLPKLFGLAMNRLTELNSRELQQARLELALDNTYDRQIDRIFRMLEATKT